ncbi:B12-binding domain-containing radical SAM protein [Vibrio alginolyticus]|uniref:B12-binding domain-containing radical SAM protein n=2 Tax=Vibrionaceae TaxID=641 RepID=UPI00280CC848|nr:radical SAM protein [Vibrio sp. 2033]EJN3357165.1 radical SAM protein [Vibrio alginolyticus]EJS0369027.1 radical SAM protein [Vibrio alginolyticus]ELB2830442.1 radical SAM protein [Vibrio alginolyticus]
MDLVMSKNKKCLLVTFDYTQKGKSATSFAAGVLLSECRQHKDYGQKFTAEHLSIDMNKNKVLNLSAGEIANRINGQHKLEEIDGLALGCYVWNTELIEPLITQLKDKGFKGNIILGGYQVHESSCEALYPGGDIYLPSYAEATLPEAFMQDKLIRKLILNNKFEFASRHSPYLSGLIELDEYQAMAHWETQRGCYYACSFCAHRDVAGNKVHDFSMEIIKKELDLFKAKKVKRINVLDPIFRKGRRSYEILEYAIGIGLEAELVFQVRFEDINERLLALFSKLNTHLEFGLQTAIKSESIVINRRNNIEKVSSAISMLQDKNMSFEVSLIYGLPTQTIESFFESVDFLKRRGVSDVKAFPLMLLEGTQLAADKEVFGIKEGHIDDSGIPHVIESDSFTKDEWKAMRDLAMKLTSLEESACLS